MTFKTESGSIYEVNHAKKHIRRISGTHAPTNSQGEDGKWKQFHYSLIELGRSAVIGWFATKRGYTITSCVTEIKQDSEPCAV